MDARAGVTTTFEPTIANVMVRRGGRDGTGEDGSAPSPGRAGLVPP